MPVVVLGVAGTVVTVPFAALGPGPTYNTLGDADGVPVVEIDGVGVDPTTGHLNMTTVAVRDQLNIFEAFGYWVSGRQGLVPREEVYPPDKTKVTIGSSASASIEIVVSNEDGERTESVTLGARPDDPEKGYLGVTPAEKPDVPFTVKFNLADVGGPSAGLMFSLAVVDKLSPGELSNGDFVAGTGTIDAAGTVGPIGGIPYKLIAAREAGATTFLVPSNNCEEAKQNVPDGLQLVRVDSLDGAIESLQSIGDGGVAPTC